MRFGDRLVESKARFRNAVAFWAFGGVAGNAKREIYRGVRSTCDWEAVSTESEYAGRRAAGTFVIEESQDRVPRGCLELRSCCAQEQIDNRGAASALASKRALSQWGARPPRRNYWPRVPASRVFERQQVNIRSLGTPPWPESLSSSAMPELCVSLRAYSLPPTANQPKSSAEPRSAVRTFATKMPSLPRQSPTSSSRLSDPLVSTR